MPHDDRLTSDALLKALAALASAGHERASSAQLVEATGASLSAVKRMLSRLLADKRIEATGKARATRYRLLAREASVALGETAARQALGEARGRAAPIWRSASVKLRQRLALPLAARSPATYRREFVDEYKPNETFLLPRELAEELAALGRHPSNCRRARMSARFWSNC